MPTTHTKLYSQKRNIIEGNMSPFRRCPGSCGWISRLIDRILTREQEMSPKGRLGVEKGRASSETRRLFAETPTLLLGFASFSDAWKRSWTLIVELLFIL